MSGLENGTGSKLKLLLFVHIIICLSHPVINSSIIQLNVLIRNIIGLFGLLVTENHANKFKKDELIS